MALYSQSIQNLIAALSRLPGIGRKSAQKLAFYILEMDPQEANTLAQSILKARENVHVCSVCCNLTETDPCEICSSPKRDHSVICVVGEPKDVVAIEKTREYKGLYHVLGGLIAPMDNIGPQDLSVRELLVRLQGDAGAKEVILATNLTVEGETTALYLAKLLAPVGIKVTRIAKGVPSGADLEYTDTATLASAITMRKEIQNS